MRATKTPDSNLALTLPGDKTGDRTLHAVRLRTYDPGLGESIEDAHDATETTWVPEDAREVAALMRGAPVKLIVHGTGHPPVSVQVGDPPKNSERVIGETHVMRALGVMWGQMTSQLLVEEAESIGQFLREGKGKGSPWFMDLWHKALADAADSMKAELVASEESLDDANPDSKLRDDYR